MGRGRAGPRRSFGGPVVLRPSLKRVVPGSVPPWRALALRGPAVVSGCRASFFVPLSWFSTPGRKHGSDGLARLQPCCDAADFLQAPSQEKQARSRQAIGVASEAPLRARSRCFLTNFLWFVFSFCLRARSCFFLFATRP